MYSELFVKTAQETFKEAQGGGIWEALAPILEKIRELWANEQIRRILIGTGLGGGLGGLLFRRPLLGALLGGAGGGLLNLLTQSGAGAEEAPKGLIEGFEPTTTPMTKEDLTGPMTADKLRRLNELSRLRAQWEQTPEVVAGGTQTLHPVLQIFQRIFGPMVGTGAARAQRPLYGAQLPRAAIEQAAGDLLRQEEQRRLMQAVHKKTYRPLIQPGKEWSFLGPKWGAPALQWVVSGLSRGMQVPRSRALAILMSRPDRYQLLSGMKNPPPGYRQIIDRQIQDLKNTWGTIEQPQPYYPPGGESPTSLGSLLGKGVSAIGLKLLR